MAAQALSPIARRVLLGAALALLLPGCALTPRSPGPAARAAAPGFSLPSHHGVTVSLAELRRDGPAVVMFYRGYW